MPRAGTEVCIKWRSTFLRCHAGLNPLPRSISSLSLAYFITPSFNAQLAPPPLVPFSHVRIVITEKLSKSLTESSSDPTVVFGFDIAYEDYFSIINYILLSLLLSCLVSKGEKPISSCGNLIKVKEGNRDRESPNTGGNKSGDV